MKQHFLKQGLNKLSIGITKTLIKKSLVKNFTSFSSETVHDYTSFEVNFLGVLNKHTPLKKKVIRETMHHVTEALRREIMKRSYLEKKDNRIFEKV